jgi:hypothetical protein
MGDNGGIRAPQDAAWRSKATRSVESARSRRSGYDFSMLGPPVLGKKEFLIAPIQKEPGAPFELI